MAASYIEKSACTVAGCHETLHHRSNHGSIVCDASRSQSYSFMIAVKIIVLERVMGLLNNNNMALEKMRALLPLFLFLVILLEMTTSSQLYPYYNLGGHCKVQKTYHSSSLEAYWMRNIEALATKNAPDKWIEACKVVRSQKKDIDIYLKYWEERSKSWTSQSDLGFEASQKGSFDKDVFSYFTIKHICTGTVNKRFVHEVPIEPLMGTLRHPLFYCFSCGDERNCTLDIQDYMLSKDYMLPSFNFEHKPNGMEQLRRRQSRSYFFDLGASLYREGAGGASQEWFVDTYASQGVKFDRILAWEATPHDPSEVFRQYPKSVLSLVSYFNIPADPRRGASANPLRVLEQLVLPGDFVVVKIDIDNTDVELSFIQQILHDKKLSSLIDELYFEHHVNSHPLRQLWRVTKDGDQNVTDSYNMFHRLRHLGIRAHSWV